MNIPVRYIEEHNEAFLSWHEFVRDGYIPQEGNYLLHVDHHTDFELNVFGFDPCNIPDEIREIERITYEELGIADFIIPAIHKKLISVYHMVGNLQPEKLEQKSMVSRCVDGKEIMLMEYMPLFHKELIEKGSPRLSHFYQLNNGLGDIQLDTAKMPGGRYILDVDLDYFCWDDSQSDGVPKIMEITEDAYREYQDNRYHPFRILPSRCLHTREENGRYYIEYIEGGTPEKVFSNEQIEKRMDTLIEWLRKQEAVPAAVDICASRFSGYLPGYAWPFVRDRFTEKLKEYLSSI